jgi:general secretion pathway protein L
MRPRLIVRQPAAHQEPTWVLTDSQGRAEGSAVTGNTEGMRQAARGRELVMLLPGVSVLLTQVSVPTQNRSRLGRAVPFALEDQLSADVEQLHFGIGHTGADGATSVAVVDRNALRALLDGLEQDGLEVHQVYPETLALPWQEDSWTLLIEDDGFLLRTGAQSGFAGDTENLALLLEAALAEAGDNAPRSLSVYHPPQCQPPLPESAPSADFHVVADATALLAEHLDGRSAIGLRTGDFASVPARKLLWRRWRAAAVLVLALVVISTARGWAEQWQLQRELNALQTRIHSTFERAFPDSGVPAGQELTVMRNRLERLRSGDDAAAGSDMLALLERAAPVLEANPELSVQVLGYRGGGLDLELRLPSLQAMEQLQSAFARAGLVTEVEGARSDADGVQGRLRLEAGS